MYVPSALDFDGASDYLTRGADLTGNADGKVGLFSCWFRIDGGNDTTRRIYANQASRVSFYISGANNKITLVGRNSSGATVLSLRSSTAITVGTAWYNLISSWDLANDNKGFYLNGSDDLTEVTFTDDTIEYTRNAHGIGADDVGSNPWNGTVAEFYFALEYLDLSVEANRRKFITVAGKPEDLGSDGSAPTGTAPIIYMKFAPGATADNSGTGGNFTASGAPAPAIGPVTPRQGRARGAHRPRRRM